MGLNAHQFHSALKTGEALCIQCGKAAPLHLKLPPFIPKNTANDQGIHYLCPHCGNLNYSALSGIAISTPQAQNFWRANPRIRRLPSYSVEHNGRAALVLGWESVQHSSRQLAVIFAQDTFEMISIVGAENRE